MKRELSLEVYKHFCHHSRTKKNHLTSIPSFPAERILPNLAGRKKHPYAYYNQFKPILHLLLLFGRYAIHATDQGEYRVRWISFRMMYCVLCYGAQTYLAVLVCFKRIQAVFDSAGDYDEFIFSIHVLAYLNIHFHVPFTYWLQASKMAQYLKQWADFQDEWERTFGKSLKMNYDKTVITVIVVVIPCVMMFLIFEQQTTLNDPLLYFMPYFFTIVSATLILCFWFCTCLEIKRLSEDLTIILTERLETQSTPWFLSRWRLLWLDLRSLTESLGSDLCFVLLSTMITYSTTFLLGAYNGLVQVITSSFSLKSLGYLSAASLSLCLVFGFCDGGHRATSGVVPSTLASLLKRKLSMNNQEIRNEVYLLLETIKANPAEIRLGGFVTLNRPLVVSLISNTLTYLIVLLQFKINEENQKISDESNQNFDG